MKCQQRMPGAPAAGDAGACRAGGGHQVGEEAHYHWSLILTESSRRQRRAWRRGEKGPVSTPQHFTHTAARRGRSRVHASRNMAVPVPACSYRPRAGRAPPSD